MAENVSIDGAIPVKVTNFPALGPGQPVSLVYKYKIERREINLNRAQHDGHTKAEITTEEILVGSQVFANQVVVLTGKLTSDQTEAGKFVSVYCEVSSVVHSVSGYSSLHFFLDEFDSSKL